MSARPDGLNPQRAAEIISTLGEGNNRRGSGYLVAPWLVLTAAHVITGSVAIRVRFNADQRGQWSASAQTAWSNGALDICVLRIIEESADPPGAVPLVARVRLGRISRPPVECETLGYPRFKIRDDPLRPDTDGKPTRYRDCEHATGLATTWANRREGTLQIRVGAPERDPDPAHSPWEGMSGAPVFSSDVLVGVVGKHHASDGLGTLAAGRVDHWHEHLDSGQIHELTALIGLPDTSDGLIRVPAVALPRADGALHQLPATTSVFTGRERQLAELLELADEAEGSSGTVVISAIDGMAGIGKTTLAIHAGHQLTERFPDGQLFIDLHGHTRGIAPREPADALAAILQASEGSPGRIPADLEARAALYRNRFAGTRTLIILDNAYDEEQVRPLLPGDGGCLVLVTSRKRLKGLDEARTLSLDVLSAAEAVALFRAVAGPGRAPIGDPLLDEIAALCGRLPLALRIAAALIRHRPAWTLTRLADKLRASGPTLAKFSDGDRDLTSVFDLSYQALGDDQKLLFRRLGLHPGTDADAYAAAALLDLGVADAEDLLQDLTDHNLLTEPVVGRYRMHDLVRAYAHTRAAADPADRRDAAVERLLNYYEHTAASADTKTFRYAPHRPRGTEPAQAPALSDPQEARTWLRTERANLEACLRLVTERGEREHIVDLTEGLAELLYIDGPWSQARALHTAAVTVADQLDDRRRQADAHINLGRVLHMTGNYRHAIESLTRAAGLFHELSERSGQADTLNELGRVLHTTGDYRDADDAHTRALALYIERADVAGQADSLTYRAAIRRQADDLSGSAEDLSRALPLYEQLGDRLGQAKTLASLARVRRAASDETGAAEAFSQAATLYRELSDQGARSGAVDHAQHERRLTDGRGRTAPQPAALGPGERLSRTAAALIGLGRMYTMAGNHRDALAAYAHALEIYREQRSFDNEAWATNFYAAAFAAAGDIEQAMATYEHALRLTRKVQHQDDEAIALEGIGECHVLTGNLEGGTEYLHQALSAYQCLAMRPDIERVQARLRSLDP